MPKQFKAVSIHEPIKKGTSIGRRPNTSTMNKHKRKSLKKYRGQRISFGIGVHDSSSALLSILLNNQLEKS